MELWAVCRRLPDQGEHAWELNGIYDSREAALAACTDDGTAAALFELNKDYSDVKDFTVISPWTERNA
jgi:hypothetical protein